MFFFCISVSNSNEVGLLKIRILILATQTIYNLFDYSVVNVCHWKCSIILTFRKVLKNSMTNTNSCCHEVSVVRARSERYLVEYFRGLLTISTCSRSNINILRVVLGKSAVSSVHFRIWIQVCSKYAALAPLSTFLKLYIYIFIFSKPPSSVLNYTNIV